jgi:hypothetical protein
MMDSAASKTTETPSFNITGTLTHTEKEWIDVLLRSWAVMHDRQAKRPDVWRRSGAKGMVFELFAKAERLFTNVMADQADHDEARAELLDIVNYAIFAHVQITSGNKNGKWPWPT